MKRILAVLAVLVAMAGNGDVKGQSPYKNLPNGSVFFVELQEPISSDKACAGELYVGKLILVAPENLVVDWRDKPANVVVLESSNFNNTKNQSSRLVLQLVSLDTEFGQIMVNTRPTSFFTKGKLSKWGVFGNIWVGIVGGGFLGALTTSGYGATAGAGFGAGEALTHSLAERRNFKPEPAISETTLRFYQKRN